MPSPPRPALILRTGIAGAAAVALLAGCAAAAPAPPQPAASQDVAPLVAAAPAAAKIVTTSAVGSRAATNLYSGRIRAYGDSVMLGAAYDLRRSLHAIVNAVESRQSGSVLATVRKDWRHGRVHGPVVIHTGTNGTVSQRDLERTIGPIQRHHLVVLVNVKAARSWTGSDNRVLAAVDRKWPNVVLLDWNKRASRHGSWTYSDGIHLTPTGRRAYTRAVAAILHR